MKTKIVFFTARDLSNVGGGERMLSIIANALCDDYDITILSPYVSQPYFSFDRRIKVDNLGFKYQRNSIKRKIQLLLILGKLSAYVRKMNCDRFVASSSMAITLAGLVVPEDSKRFVAWEHTSFYHPEPSYLKWITLHNLHKFRVVSINTMDMEQYAMYSSKVDCIPNPLPFVSDVKSDCRSKRIISIGRLEKGKAFDLLIKMAPRVLLSRPEWGIDIYGQDDGEESTLKTIIADLSLSDRVVLHKPTTNIKEKYLQSSIYVTTSRIEAFSLVLLEACACGLPCVAYDVPSGPRDIIEDGYNGYLAKDLDEDKFVEYLSMLMDSEERRREMGRNAVETTKKFELDRIINKWKTIL